MGIIFPLILWGFSYFATAAPFLVCDPYRPNGLQPSAFEVTIDGRAERVVPRRHPDGSTYLHYDLKDLSDGAHLLKVKALDEARHTESVEEIRLIRKQGGEFSLLPVPKPKERVAPSKSYRGYIR